MFANPFAAIRGWISLTVLIAALTPPAFPPPPTAETLAPATAETITITDFSPQSGPFAGRRAGGTTNAGVSASGRVTALAVSMDGQRLYAASSNTGLWRSSNGGTDWCQLSIIIGCPDGPASAIPVPIISEVAVHPGSANGSVVLAAAAQDTRVASNAGLYRSTNAGGSWTRVHEFRCGGAIKPAYQVRFAPDENNLAFAAGGCTVARSVDGGVSWTSGVAPSGYITTSIFYIAVSEYDPAVSHHWVFACGDTGTYFSSDNGDTWTKDSSNLASAAGCGWGGAPHLMATEPGVPGSMFLARYGNSNGPRFFDSFGAECNTSGIGCGEGALYRAAYTTTISLGEWAQLASPPSYFGDPSTTDGRLANSPSGVPFVITRARPGGGYLLFFSDEATVHVSNGRPPTNYNIFASWHRLDGWDPWAYTNPGGNRRGIFIHADAYDLAVSADFSLTLLGAPAGCFDPTQNPLGFLWCGNTSYGSSQGRLWIANDGGVYFSDSAGVNGLWGPARSGLSTLSMNGAAALVRAGRGAPALYSGLQDNSTFVYNPDGINPDGAAANWGAAEVDGDNAPYFADAARPDQVVHMDSNRARQFGIFRGFYGQYPTPIYTTIAQTTVVPYPPGAMWANYFNRPVIQTRVNETAPGLADLVRIGQQLQGGVTWVPRLYRTTNPAAPNGGWQPVGPNLADTVAAEGAGAVQTSGGHASPVFYVKTSDGRLLRGTSVNGVVPSWTPVISMTGNGACLARAFYADPYNSQRLFVDDIGGKACAAGIKRSDDSGQTWQPATALQNALTNNGEFSLGCQPQRDGPNCLMNDMQFRRGEAQSIYVGGITGVFASSDGGATWGRLLNNADIPCDAAALGIDTVSALATRSVFVFCYGRSVLRISGVRGPSITANVTVDGGGALSSADGSVQVAFDPQTVRTDHTVVLAHRTESFEPLPEGRIGLTHFTLDAFDALNQPVTQLTATYTLTVKLNGEQLAFHDLSPSDVEVYHYNKVQKKWLPANSCAGCGTIHGPEALTVTLDHFSEFALLGKPNTPALETWPMFHHDPQHLGAITGQSARMSPPLGPVTRWKYQVTEPPEEARFGQYRWYSSFPIADLDGDGTLEVVVTTPDNARACDLCEPPRDRVIALKDAPGENPPVRAMWIYTSPFTPTLWGFDQYSAALVDADGDGKPDVIFTSKDGHIRALKGTDGALLWDFNSGYFIEAGPMIADLDGNGSPEVIVSTGCTPAPGCAGAQDVSSGALFVLEAHSTDGVSGTLLFSQTFPYKLDSAEPAIANLDPGGSLGVKHIVLGTWGGRLQVLWRTLDGTVFSQSLHLGALTSETLSSTPVIRSSPLLADFGEGMTAVFGWMPDANSGTQARLSAVRLSVNTLSGTAVFTPTWTRSIDDWKSSPALVPMGPARPPLVVTGYGIGLGANQGTGGYGLCNNVSGGILAMNVVSGTVAWTHDWDATGEGNVRGSPAVADFDGDGGMDVALPAGCFGKLFGYDGGTGAPKWERQLGPRTIGSPSLGDLNGDGALEIVVGSYDGNVWALTSPRWAFVPGAFR